ncbi:MULTISPECIES: hypothetical protein [Cryobacterium]|uniref:Peptide/nickel transport system ATP-binding protein/microcin C transport system ATP-binding protein n=1 Tax=Cryobacterium levicorallinum TaxID=995038 RepID=A0ABY1EEQ8_9MICO|nr:MULTISPECIES: hypothetical protein [Cryobacterium]GEP27972.1 hypothetical protein CLE01_25700 [Cryobacterium levicorallinum]SFH61113.1 peptide/nickel transport system ATP-binding protein/microcin C transport system ATP-binding protein [Cryobacterium levicorallinum]
MELKPVQIHTVHGGQIAMIFQEPMTALNSVDTIGFQIIETLRAHFGISPSQSKTRA